MNEEDWMMRKEWDNKSEGGKGQGQQETDLELEHKKTI